MEFLPSHHELLAYENELWDKEFSFVAGVDEVGRGPLAGPVVSAAVVFSRDVPIPAVNDSKQLSAKKRDAFYEAIIATPGVQYTISELTCKQVDTMNILEAARETMRLAVLKLKQVDYALIDGLPVPNFPITNQSIVKGDAKSASIAAASIIAKVYRDKLMKAYGKQYPEYGFENNMGYGTKQHLAALKKHGITPIHRHSFAAVRHIINPPMEHPDLFQF